jgi:hypothetical protein
MFYAEIPVSIPLYSIFPEKYSRKAWADVFHRRRQAGVIASEQADKSHSVGIDIWALDITDRKSQLDAEFLLGSSPN